MWRGNEIPREKKLEKERQSTKKALLTGEKTLNVKEARNYKMSTFI